MRMTLLWTLAGVLLGGCVIPLDRAPARQDSDQRSRADDSFLSLRDPVCGITCIGDRCERETFQDKQFIFCSTECKKRFVENPAPYLEHR